MQLIVFVQRASGRELNKPVIVIMVCSVMFLLGIPYCTSAGVYILELIDHYAAGFPYLCIAFLETIIIAYTYGEWVSRSPASINLVYAGISNYLRDLHLMTGWKPSLWMRSHFVVILSSICPIVIGTLLILDLKDLISPEKPFSSGTYEFPGWTNYVGWVAALIPLGVIPLLSIHYLLFNKKGLTFWDRLRCSLTPTDLYFANSRRNKLQVSSPSVASTLNVTETWSM